MHVAAAAVVRRIKNRRELLRISNGISALQQNVYTLIHTHSKKVAQMEPHIFIEKLIECGQQ